MPGKRARGPGRAEFACDEGSKGRTGTVGYSKKDAGHVLVVVIAACSVAAAAMALACAVACLLGAFGASVVAASFVTGFALAAIAAIVARVRLLLEDVQ